MTHIIALLWTKQKLKDTTSLKRPDKECEVIKKIFRSFLFYLFMYFFIITWDYNQKIYVSINMWGDSYYNPEVYNFIIVSIIVNKQVDLFLRRQAVSAVLDNITSGAIAKPIYSRHITIKILQPNCWYKSVK